MADNVSITPGSGDTVAADDIGGAKYQRVKMVIGADGVNDGDISSANPMPVTGSFSGTTAIKAGDGTFAVYFSPSVPSVKGIGVLSTTNSSTATLGSGATFTGTGEEVLNYNWIQVNIFSDQASATNGLSLQYSSDNTNWDATDVYTIAASTGKLFSVQTGARYFRVVYTNGATLQGAFRLQTIYKYSASKASSQRASDSYTNETDLEQMQAFNMALNPAGTWDRMRSDQGVAVGAIRMVHATDVATSVNVVSGILPTVTRVSNVVDGTLTTVTTVGRVNNLVAGTVTLTGTNSTLAVSLDPGHTLGSISSIGSTVAVFFSPANPAVNATFTSTSLEVVPSTGSRNITDAPAAAMRVLIVGSQTNASLAISNIATTVTIKTDPGAELGSIKGINSTVSVAFSPAKPIVLADNQHTSSIFTVSGTTGTAGNNALVNPSASYNFKIFAYSIQTTGIVSSAPRFTTGGSGGATEVWRPLINAVQSTSAPIGANLAVAPPGYLFSMGTNVTLNLYLDTGSLMHYSVSYIKESA